MRASLILAGLVAAGTLACRPGPGEPDYPDYTPFVDTDDDGFLQGPNPYEEGDKRLSFGAFYEGKSSDQLLVDDETVFYYIYQGYGQTTSADRIEGYVSDQLTLSGSSWWGGGVQIADAGTPVDLSGWDTMHIALLSEDPEMEAFKLGMAGTGGEVRITPGDYGFVADGEWHALEIPMSTFAGAQLDSIKVMLLIISETGAPGTSVLIDDFYLEGE